MPQNSATSLTISLEGPLKRVLFYNAENAYTVGQLYLQKEKRTVTITGLLPSVQCGETLTVKGQWARHPQYGQHFLVEQFESRLPADVHGIRQYLSSGLVRGIGKVYATKIVDYFGAGTFEILNHESARLREVPGIGPMRAKSVKKAWDEQQAVREIMIFLRTYGFSSTQCLRLFRRYGNRAKDLIRENPYRMVDDVDGIGFLSADQVALNLGFANDSPFRVDSGIEYVLRQEESRGNTAMSPKQLVTEAARLLAVEIEKVRGRLSVLLSEGRLSHWSRLGCVQRHKMAVAEALVARHVKRLKEAPTRLPSIRLEGAFGWTERKLHLQWSEEQKEALTHALKSKLVILTGGPGTGKTTLLRALTEVLKAKKVRLSLMAPTGRAAQRLSEATDYSAKTVHRALKFEPSVGGFMFNATNPLPTDFIVVDEASMLDVHLTVSLFDALLDSTHVLLVGDIHQLPSVGPGNVLHDLIKSEFWDVHSLHEVFRQGERSKIVSVAHDILAGNSTLSDERGTDEDFHFVPVEDPEKCLQTVEELCWVDLPQHHGVDPIRDVQVLVPMHRGSVGVEVINRRFQERLGAHRRGLTVGQQTYYQGDKVIQLKNNYERNIFNGDLGMVCDVDAEEGQMTVEFGGEKKVLERLEILDLKPAYAISIHKSQGSEFPIVVVLLLKQHFLLLKRNLIYTAITRGRKKVYLVGDIKAYARAVHTPDSTVRWTTLSDRLRGIN
ncbi:MAG: ATP-dependent RecD-like DNA helicase [Puniceicoccales bacterium]|nr:ATP-dependent RecD-like DNA helicase [Puniceicoccales bacterium]